MFLASCYGNVIFYFEGMGSIDWWHVEKLANIDILELCSYNDILKFLVSTVSNFSILNMSKMLFLVSIFAHINCFILTV